MSLSACLVDRRGFLRMGALGATGLLIGFYLPERVEALAAAGGAPKATIALHAWIHVGTDDLVTILIDKSEMGQSILTRLAMLAAEELECDWKKVRTEFAPADKVYFNPQFGAQGTGRSSATRTSWEPLRKAGAAARRMVLEASAQKRGVDKSECRSENGAVLHAATKRQLTYGSLAEAAAKLPVPPERAA
jgi:isoquinoline 1-oxidoreductase beta subunit